MITISRSSFLYVDGDSIADPSLSYQSFNGARFNLQSKYYTPDNGSYRRPLIWNSAVSGSTTANILARVLATIPARRGLTHLIIASGGINDVFTGVPQATSVTNFSAIINAGLLAGLQVMWIGPCWLSEHWPSNITVYGPAIDSLDNAFISAASSLDVTYVSVRRSIYNALEPIYNAPSPGADDGILTVAPSVIGEHPNPFGCVQYTKSTTPHMTET